MLLSGSKFPTIKSPINFNLSLPHFPKQVPLSDNEKEKELIEHELHEYKSSYENRLNVLLSAGGYLAIGKPEDSINISYQVYGTGPKKLMFVMGINGTTTHWSFQVLYFAKLPDYQVCVFDNRGIGKSTTGSKIFTTKDMATDALYLLDHLGWNENVNLAGISMGGMISQIMVTMQPARFETVTFSSTYTTAALVVPTIDDIQLTLKLLSRTRLELIRPLIKICFTKSWLDSKMDGYNFTHFQLMEFLSKFVYGEPEENQSIHYLQIISAILHNIPILKLRQLKNQSVRSLVIHGDKDKVIRPTYGYMLASCLRSDFLRFRKAGHMVNIELADNFNLALRAHIENVPLQTYLEMDSDSTHVTEFH